MKNKENRNKTMIICGMAALCVAVLASSTKPTETTGDVTDPEKPPRTVEGTSTDRAAPWAATELQLNNSL